jgi:GNAT superfamily N-acetyltransferase
MAGPGANAPPPPGALARRLELCSAWRGVRYAQAYARLRPERQVGLAAAAVLPVGGGYAAFVAPGSPVSAARGLGMNGPVSDADLDQLEDFYHSRGERVRLHVCPLADSSLLARVRQRGYRLEMFFSTLALPIPQDFQPNPLPEGMRLRRALPADADTWLRVSAQGFEASESPPPTAFEILGPNFYAEDGAPFIAWMDGSTAGPASTAPPAGGTWEPAGCGGLYLAPQVQAVELGGASTRAAYRRRGVQRALIEARLAEALRQGCDLAMVLTEPGSGSQSNLQHAGFSLAYTKIVMEK